MAKKKQEQHVEEIIDVEVIEKTEFNVLLPEVPSIFLIEDKKSKELKEYSLAVVADLEKEADALIKAIKNFDDKKGYEALDAKKQELVKVRTTLENKRKEVTAPINEFTRTLKSKTDEIGHAAQAVQDKIQSKLNEREAHEAELKRLEEERIQKMIDDRTSELVEIAANYNPLSGIFSFDYSGEIINYSQISEFEDDEWKSAVDRLKELKAAYEKEQEEARREEEEKNKQLQEKSIKLRTKEVTLLGAEFNDNAWNINGVSITPEDVKSLDDDQWDELIERAGTVPEPPLTPEVNTKPVEEKIVPPAPPIDPIQAIISGKVEEHVEHQNKVEGKVATYVEFTPEQPFMQFHLLRSSYMRIFPAQYEDQALDIPNQKESIIGSGQVGDVDLLFIVFKKG